MEMVLDAMHRIADQFRAIQGQILAYEYTRPPNAVKEWSDFDHMEVLSWLEARQLRHRRAFRRLPGSPLLGETFASGSG